MKKAIFIIGPTAVGKTALAVSVHRKIPSILISADSIQAYREANVISGKDHPGDVKIELIDIANPSDSFNVRDFTDKVRQILEKNNEKLPIFVGGTGMYVKSLFSKIPTISIPPNKKLRRELEKLSVEDLQEKLKILDKKKFNSFNESDINNPRRLIRAIEVAGFKNESLDPVFNEEDVLIIGLKTSQEELDKRIKERVNERIKIGALDEAKKLFKNYKKLSPQLKTANGYKQMFMYLSGEISFEEANEQWFISDRQHAKMQTTYFKKLTNIHWFNIDEKDFKEKISRLISSQIDL